MLDDYSKIREKLFDLQLRVAQALQTEESRHVLSEIGKRVAENEFCLVVAGQFKRGKSTLINALLGDDLLPTAIIPVTSIVTEIRYGRSLAIRVIYNSGADQAISREQLSLYVTEKHNPKNEKDVRLVEILHPSIYLRNGVRIIDTPGVGSVHSHNTETTYSYLPNADAAIFLVSVDPPITEAEYHFLGDLNRFAARLFFIQNKIDMVSDSEREESLQFTKHVIEEHAGLKDVTIFPLSAKNALDGKQRNESRLIEESGLPDFERRLGDFFMRERGQVLLDSATNKIRNVIAGESFSARVMQKALGEPLKDLEEKISAFAQAEEKIAQERRDSGHLVRAETNELVAEVLIPALEDLRTNGSRVLAGSIDEHYRSQDSKGNKELAGQMNIFIHQQIHDTFNEFQAHLETKLRKRLEAILERLVSRTNQIINRIVAISSSIFEMDVEPFAIDESLARESGFQFKIDEDVKVSLEAISESLTFLLPRPLAHRIILRGARMRMAKQVDRHCGRLRHDFVSRIEETVEIFQQQLDETVEAALDGIRRALDAGRRAHEKSEQDASEAEDRIRKRLEVFENSLKELDDLRKAQSFPPVNLQDLSSQGPRRTN